MSEVLVVMLDNSIYMCNQDYFPNRYLLQTEALRKYIENKLTQSAENEVCVIPLAQPTPHFIASPTKNMSFIDFFLTKVTLNRNLDLKNTCFLASKALEKRERRDGNLILCIGSKLKQETMDEHIMSAVERLKNLLEKDVHVNLIFLAEAQEYKEVFDVQLEHSNYNSIYVSPEDDFVTVLSELTNVEDLDSNDPELAMAIKLSLEEAKKNQNK